MLAIYQHHVVSLPTQRIERMPLTISSSSGPVYGLASYYMVPKEGQQWQQKDVFVGYETPEQADYRMIADVYFIWHGPAKVLVQIGFGHGDVRNLVLDMKIHSELEETASQFGFEGIKMDPDMQVWYAMIPVHLNNMPFLRIASLVDEPTQLGLAVIQRNTRAM